MTNLYLLGKKTSLPTTDCSIHSGQEKNKAKQNKTQNKTFNLVFISVLPHRSRSGLPGSPLSQAVSPKAWLKLAQICAGLLSRLLRKLKKHF